MVMMKESCINMYNIFDITFREMNVNQLAVWFFIYSFFGWAMECIVIRKQLGYWENRGFAKLPFCVIYGFGVFIAFHIFAPIEGNYPAFMLTMVKSSLMDEVQDALKGTAAATLAAYDQNTGDYLESTNGDIWKGSYNISKSENLVDRIKENTGMDVTFFTEIKES